VVKAVIKPIHTLFVDGYIISIVNDDGNIEKYYMKFEDGIKNVMKWNVLSTIVSTLKIISPNYAIADPNERWLNELRVNIYLRNVLKNKNFPLYVPKIVTEKVKKIPEVRKFLRQWEEYRYTIFEFVEGPTLQQILAHPEKYNITRELELVGKCVGVLHGLGVIQFDRRTTNDIRTSKGYCCVDFSLAKIFRNKNLAYYKGLAYDMEHQSIWLTSDQFEIFKESHDKMLEQFPDVDFGIYEKEVKNTKRLFKSALVLRPILKALNAI